MLQQAACLPGECDAESLSLRESLHMHLCEKCLPGHRASPLLGVGGFRGLLQTTELGGGSLARLLKMLSLIHI